jgi:hypothetical protein
MAERTDWKPDESRVLVVAAGRAARDQAMKYAVYQCQNHRSFQPCRWIAFYAKGRIDTLAEIDGPPEDDVIVADRGPLTGLAASMDEGSAREPRSLMRLKNVVEIKAIQNDQQDRNGRRVAWVQGQRYTTIAKLRAASHTSDL